MDDEKQNLSQIPTDINQGGVTPPLVSPVQQVTQKKSTLSAILWIFSPILVATVGIIYFLVMKLIGVSGALVDAPLFLAQAIAGILLIVGPIVGIRRLIKNRQNH